jgi:putative restriction endonuclease
LLSQWIIQTIWLHIIASISSYTLATNNSQKSISMPKKINQEQRAFRAWDILIQCAAKKDKLTYGDLAVKLGIHHRAIRFVLGPILDYCLLNELPPLSILVINKGTREPGLGFFQAWDIENSADGFDKVFKFNWKALHNPFKYSENGVTQEQLILEMIEHPEESGEVFSRVKVRGIAQRIFRLALLRIYHNQCAFCGFSFIESLEGAHIIPYSLASKKERLDVRNGLLLCSIHHKMFDKGLLLVTDEYKINYESLDDDLSEYNKYDKLMSIELHNKKINLPKNKLHYPKKVNLDKHRKSFQ